MSLWDCISVRLKTQMAEMMQSSSASDTKFLSFDIVVRKNGEIVELKSRRRLPSLFPYSDMIQALDSPLRTLEVIISPTEGVQALYIAMTDLEHTRSWAVPKEAWKQVCVDLGLDTTKPQEC